MLIIGIPWTFVYFITHPGCPHPVPLAGISSPREVWLVASDGIEVRAWYFPGTNHAAILTLGGMNGALGTNLPAVEGILKAGYSVLQIDTRACAHPSAPVTLGYDEIRDAEAGIKYLLSQPEVEPQRIGIFGFSMGGAGAIRTAARHLEVSALVSEGGYANLGDLFIQAGSNDWIIRIFRWIMIQAYRLHTGLNPWESSPIIDLPHVSPRPVFLIYGENEAGEHAYAQFNAAKDPKSMWIVPGGSHGNNYSVNPLVYNLHVVEFFNQSLLEP